MQTKSGKNLSPIGIGTYGIGGRGHRDMEITEKKEDRLYVEVLIYALKQGLNFSEISLGYAKGASITLFKQALAKSQIPREDFFLTHSLYPRDLPTVKTIKEDIASFYKILETDYADSTLVTQSLILKFSEKTIYDLLDKLLTQKKTRYVSLSNASPNWIKRFHKRFGDKFFAHEGHLSYEIRALEDKGVFDLCRKLKVENIIWRPLRRNATSQKGWEMLHNLAQKYNKTQNQIILNWLCQEGFRPMVMSSNQKHIKENLEALSFQMNPNDYQKINQFRPPNYSPPPIDWEGIGIDDDIVGMVLGF
jgi:diketogulonate reductase-like aldo/keto reductase